MKKGYTLVELLIVVVIISIIAILALTNITKNTSKVKNISSKKVEELIKSSAKSYFYNNKQLRQDVKNGAKGKIPYSTLKDKSYLNDNLINVKTYKKIDINNSCVCVTYSNYEYIFNIQQPCDCD
ncbi:MAG: prepilin-type N-terminal cleavage/methylation domain-containing protein [Bacilli bacterium]|nr:prepilin-type N-terminal cleavage/methylation domain-containing protein [Bacilli bacterium]